MVPEQLNGPVLALFRMVTGVLFLCHGAASLFGVLGGNTMTGKAVPFAEWPGWWAALIQLVCGALVLVGLLTRPAALLASGSMAYAYFVVHQPEHPLPLQNGGELAALFSWSFLLVAVLGPGNWALDALLSRRRGMATEAGPAARPSVPA
ncbi:DoxX family protein [Micromonospora sp. NPDC023966]|uniref:DoxX family protein n=1 Tax=Micromonospora sp. NPDC023966 TaxID=3154699 RepID=UPI0033E5928D